MLEQLGYTVSISTSSLEALRTFQENPESFDALITDQTLPDMTGAELAKQVMLIRPDIPVILCTGYSNVINKEHAQSLGIKGFLMKPIPLGELGALLRTLLSANKGTELL